jgi:hypothetical protein
MINKYISVTCSETYSEATYRKIAESDELPDYSNHYDLFIQKIIPVPIDLFNFFGNNPIS